MTAEIAILNRQGIALAADSAVTIGKQRVWKTANKLFSLGPVNDIAIMVYNVGDFVGVPWEIVVKEFRERVALKRYDHVRECELDFFQFLNSALFRPGGDTDLSSFSILLNFVDKLLPFLSHRTLTELQSQLDDAIDAVISDYGDADKLDDFISIEVFKKQFYQDIAVLCKEALRFRLTKPYLNKVIEMLYDIISRKNDSQFMTGLVFAGSGKTQLMPYVAHYLIDGKFEYLSGKETIGETRFWLANRCDLNDKNEGSAYVFPFAQFDMFYLFMEGISPRHLIWIDTMVEKILKDKADGLISSYVPSNEQVVEKRLQDAENSQTSETLREEFSKFRRKTLVGPVLDVIKALPKEEMAAMAEALVELTALRRKVGSNLETVGGPPMWRLYRRARG